MNECSCPQTRGRRITNPERHQAWHQQVIDQGGPAGLVNAATLQAARGIAGGTATGPTIVDKRAVDSGKRVPGWRRRAASASTYEEWLGLFVIAVTAIPAGVEFTTAELHGRIPDPPHHNHWGRATGHVAKLGLIRKVSTQTSELETTKDSLVRRWVRVTEVVAA